MKLRARASAFREAKITFTSKYWRSSKFTYFPEFSRDVSIFAIAALTIEPPSVGAKPIVPYVAGFVS